MEIIEKQFFENSDIISAMSKWRIIRLKDLDLFTRNVSKKGYYGRVQKLEKDGLIVKIKIPASDRAKRYALIFSKIAQDYLKISYQQERFLHDLMVSTVVASFKELPSFLEVYFEHELESVSNSPMFSDSGVYPDATVIAQSTDSKIEFKLAIEVEMTRKSKSRIQEKFKKYLDIPTYNTAIYFFIDRASFNAYSKYLCETYSDYPEKKRNGIVLTLINDPNSVREQLLELETFSSFGSLKFGEIFK